MEKIQAYLAKPRNLILLGATVLSLGSISLLWVYRKRVVKLLAGGTQKKRRQRKKNGSVNIGAIFGMDVGGTLTKIVYFQARPTDVATDNTGEPLPKRKSSDSLAQLDSPDHQAALKELYNYMDNTSQKNNGVVIRDAELSVYLPFLDGQIHFLHFETRNMMTAINVLGANAVTENIKSIGCTGGGAHKYANKILEELEITVNKHDELGCLVRGMHFALTNFPDECFTYRNADKDKPVPSNLGHIDEEMSAEDADGDVPIAVKRWQKDAKEYTKKVYLPYPSLADFPYLVVNIGSGVSILKVSSPGVYERVSGTSLGGGTYWGLCRLLTHCATYDQVLDLAETGDAGTVDMLVKDIYGGDYGSMLSGSMVASSFGKLVMKEDPREGVREEDLALAMLMMITNNIGQIAHLNAQLHNCQKIFFVGSFLRHNSISCRRLAFAIDFWSNGSMEALFLTHEGYFGAMGTFLQSVFGEDVDKVLNEVGKASAKGREDREARKRGDGNTEDKVEAEDGAEDAKEAKGEKKRGWGSNIRDLAKWSASLAQISKSDKDKGEQTKREQRRVRSSSEDYYRHRKGDMSPKGNL